MNIHKSCYWERYIFIKLLLAGILVNFSLVSGAAENAPAAKGTQDKAAIESEIAEKKDKRVWPHRLPIWGQQVIDLGYDLPKPFGISLTYERMQHDLMLDNLTVGVRANSEAPVLPLDIPADAFANVEDDNQSVLLRFDAFIFPFLNIYALAGQIEGTTRIPLDDELESLMTELCQGDCGILSPSGDADYSGETYGIGIILAGGYKNMFGVFNAAFNRSDIDLAPGANIISLNLSLRAGINSAVGDWGKLATYTGVTYLTYDVEIRDKLVLGASDESGPSLVIDYALDAKEKRDWNSTLR